MVDRYAREVEDFKFLPLRQDQNERRLRVTICINGWLDAPADVSKPWRILSPTTEAFALQYDLSALLGLGTSIRQLVTSAAFRTVGAEILKHTVLSTLSSALWPAYLLSAGATLVDNPFSIAKARSEKAGRVLADALINRVQGERPVTLIGYSLGARVIYTCLQELAARGAFGLVEDVVMIGAAVPSDKNEWETMRSVVSGKMYNAYSENDFLLAFLYRATAIQLGVAGLQAIEGVEGVENVNVGSEVEGHVGYRKVMGRILRRCGIAVVEKEVEGKEEEEEGEIRLIDGDPDLIDFEVLRVEDAQEGGRKTAGQEKSSASEDLLGLDLGETKGLEMIPSMTPGDEAGKKMAPLIPMSQQWTPSSGVSHIKESTPAITGAKDSNPKIGILEKLANDRKPSTSALSQERSTTTSSSIPIKPRPAVNERASLYMGVQPGDFAEDEEDEWEIKLIDNEELEYVEPRPIED